MEPKNHQLAGGKETLLAGAVNNGVNVRPPEFELEEFYRAIFNSGIFGIITINKNGFFVTANDSFCKIIGYTEAELKKMRFRDITYPETVEKDVQALQDLVRGKIKIYRTVKRYIRKNKDVIWVSIAATPIFDHNGKLLMILTIVEDITEQKKLQETVKESEEKFRALVDFSPDCIKMFDLDRKLIYLSPGGWNEHMLKNNTDITGWDYLSSIEKDHREKFKKAFEKAKTGESITIEIKHNLEKCRSEWCLMTLSPIKSEKNKVAKIFAVSRNISEHKKTEKNLKESEEKFRVLAEKSPVMVFINKGGKVVYANDKCEEMTGYKKEEFYSPNFDFMALIDKEHKEKVKKSFMSHVAGQEVEPYEYNLVTKNGSTIRAFMSTRLIPYEGGRAVLGIIADLTEHFEFEKKLKEGAETIKALMNAPVDAAYLLDKDGRIASLNEAGAKRLLKNPDELIGKVCYDFFPTELAKARKEKINQVFDSGKPIFFEDKRSDQILYNSVYPILGEDGSVAKVALYVVDITERKKAEEDLKKQYLKLEKMNRLMVGRELKMAELKKQIIDLKQHSGDK